MSQTLETGWIWKTATILWRWTFKYSVVSKTRSTPLPRSTFSTSTLNKSLLLNFATKSAGLRRLSLKLKKFFLIMNILWTSVFMKVLLTKELRNTYKWNIKYPWVNRSDSETNLCLLCPEESCYCGKCGKFEECNFHATEEGCNFHIGIVWINDHMNSLNRSIDSAQDFYHL